MSVVRNATSENIYRNPAPFHQSLDLKCGIVIFTLAAQFSLQAIDGLRHIPSAELIDQESEFQQVHHTE